MAARCGIAVIMGSLAIQTGCATYSLREATILSKLPESYRKHNSGFAVPPTEAQVAEAIQLGTADKEGDVVKYAYLSKPNLKTYVTVSTPLHLIAEHARERAREYREPDPNFITYCKGLDAVRIALQEQDMTRNLNVIVQPYSVILLRDGKRVEPLTMISGFNGMNPFFNLDKELAAIFQGASASAAAINKQIQATLRKSLAELPPEALASLPPEKQALFAALAGTKPTGSKEDSKIAVELPVTELDGLFSATELKKPGKYEVVFRTHSTANLVFGGDQERRYVIKFDRFR